MLTGYYMSRLFVLTFRGTERFREATPRPRPRTSRPWVMTLPLVVLAALSALGGVLDLPWAHGRSLATFVDPAFGYLPAGRARLDRRAVGAGRRRRRGGPGRPGRGVRDLARPGERPARCEPAFLQRVWRWDDAYDAAIGRPLTAAGAPRPATSSSRGSSTAPCAASAAGVRRSAEGVRKLQSGFVRQLRAGHGARAGGARRLPAWRGPASMHSSAWVDALLVAARGRRGRGRAVAARRPTRWPS